jgi:hypothetical protein
VKLSAIEAHLFCEFMILERLTLMDGGRNSAMWRLRHKLIASAF